MGSTSNYTKLAIIIVVISEYNPYKIISDKNFSVKIYFFPIIFELNTPVFLYIYPYNVYEHTFCMSIFRRAQTARTGKTAENASLTHARLLLYS